MARIEELSSITYQARCVCAENAEPLTFFGVLVNPINGRQVVVPNSSPWSLHVPVQGCPFLCFSPVASTARSPDVLDAGI